MRLTINDLHGVRMYSGYAIGWTPFGPECFAIKEDGSQVFRCKEPSELKRLIDAEALATGKG